MGDTNTTIQALQGMTRDRVEEPKSIFESVCTRFTEDIAEQPYILKTYDIVTPESAEYGDVEERGWADDQGNHYQTYPEDKQGDDEPPRIEIFYDEEEDLSLVDATVDYLYDKGVYAQGSDGFSYYTADPQHNYGTGDETSYAYHLYGYTEVEEEQILGRLIDMDRRV